MIEVYCTYGDLRRGGYGWIMYAHLRDGRELYAEGVGSDDEGADAHDSLWWDIVEQAEAAGLDYAELVDMWEEEN